MSYTFSQTKQNSGPISAQNCLLVQLNDNNVQRRMLLIYYLIKREIIKWSRTNICSCLWSIQKVCMACTSI